MVTRVMLLRIALATGETIETFIFADVTVTVIDRDLVAVDDAASVTLTVKVDVPVAVGVPEMPPELFRLRPAGSEPPERDHV